MEEIRKKMRLNRWEWESGGGRKRYQQNRKKSGDRRLEATNEEQHRRHFYRLFSLVLRIRSRDRARNDITAPYELHLRNTGMPRNPHRCSSSEWFSGRNGRTRHARKVPSLPADSRSSRSAALNRSTPMTTLFITRPFRSSYRKNRRDLAR